MKNHEIVASCFLLAGLALESLVYIWHESMVMRGIGAIVIFFGIAIEIVGIAILENDEKQHPKK